MSNPAAVSHGTYADPLEHWRDTVTDQRENIGKSTSMSMSMSMSMSNKDRTIHVALGPLECQGGEAVGG